MKPYAMGVFSALAYAAIYGGGCYAMSFAYTGHVPVNPWVVWALSGGMGLIYGGKAAVKAFGE